MSTAFIQSLGKRIESFLPNRTGYSIAEVELNPQFMVTRNILLNSNTNIFASDVMQTFCGILETINIEANNADLNERSIQSISSSLIILKLLFDFVNHHWVSKRDTSMSSQSSIVSSSSQEGSGGSGQEGAPSLTAQNFDYSRPFNFAMYYHYEPPKKLNSGIIHPCIEIIMSLFSTQMARRTLALVKKIPTLNPPMSSSAPDDHGERESSNTLTTTFTSSSGGVISPTQSHAQDPNTSSVEHESYNAHDSIRSNTNSNPALTESEKENIPKMILDVDNYCSVLLKFLAVSNPSDYYGYIDLRLFSYAKKGQIVPHGEVVKYSPLIEFIFYDALVGQGMATTMTNFLPYVKSNTWRQVVLVFYSNSIKDQCFSRPEDYNAIVQAGSELEESCKAMFDYVTTIFEGNQHLGASSMVQAWLVITCISDFIELANKPNKLKITFNRRLKFLTQILKESRNLQNLESFDSLINIFYLAARFPKSFSNHPVAKFCVEYLDTTYDALQRLNVTFNTKESAILFDNLVINLNVVAVMINPEKYIAVLIGKYYQSQGNIKEMKILVKVVKGLSELKKSQVEFDKLMIKLKNSLKNMIVGAIKILHQNQQILQNNEATGASAKSLRSGVSVNQIQQNLLQHPQLDNQSLKSFDSSSGSSNSGRFHPNRSSQASINSRKNSTENMISPTPSIRQFMEQTQNQQDQRHEEAIASDPKTVSSATSLSTSASSSPHSSSNSSSKASKVMESTEEILSDLFYIFISVPETYYIDLDYLNKHTANSASDANITLHEFHRIQKFSHEITNPLKYAFQSANSRENLLNAACSMAMALVMNDFNDLEIACYPKVVLCNFLTSNYIIHYIVDACLGLSLTDPKFKACFIFLNRFLEYRDKLIQGYSVTLNTILTNLDVKCKLEVGTVSCHALEKIFLVSLCTHDIQFFNIAKSSMQWYAEEIKTLNETLHTIKKENGDIITTYNTDLFDKFVAIMDDDSVFTGFVSLHKRFRTLIRDTKATQSVFEVWLILFNRWLNMLESGRGKSNSDVENLVLRHYTGFLVSSSGTFMEDSFLEDDIVSKQKAVEYIIQFFEKCILLLTSEDLIVRSMIKNSLSNERHPSVYHLICTKLLEIIKTFLDSKTEDNDESILFIEQVITVMTSMIAAQNDGSFVLVALLPEICDLIIKFVNKVENLSATLRLKIRFCKLSSAIEADKEGVGLRGAFRLRNAITRASLEWLQQSVFHDEEHNRKTGLINTTTTTTSSLLSSGSTTSHAENMYLNIDLATECSKALAFQLEELTLEIPDGIRDKDVTKAREIVFANYFSLLYKVLQKFTYADSTSIKSKYKIHLIIENVLKSISCILKTDTDVGMPFILPLAFHENTKIRSIFLNVFAKMFSKRKYYDIKEKLPSGVFEKFTKYYDICGSAAKVASTSEHNLLASSLFAVFGYSNKLDKLFHTLLYDEIATVSRSTDIFRRNSTLTRLLSNFAKDYGSEYLVKTLGGFVEDLNKNNVYFEVEKEHVDQIQQDSQDDSLDPLSKSNTDVDEDAELFMKYFQKLVRAITSSVDIAPNSFKFICREIYTCVEAKSEADDGLIAVGSYLFLRFLCPAIISPEVFLNIPLTNPKVKRTLMQLVKMIQNIVNGSLGVKWQRLQHKSQELEEINKEIFEFLKEMSKEPTEVTEENDETNSTDMGSSTCSKVSPNYPFQQILEPPYPEMRYLHKFFYYYFVEIKHEYIFGESLGKSEKLHRRISRFIQIDGLLFILGQPKSLLALQSNSPLKYSSNDDPNPHFTDFMGKSSLRYAEINNNLSIISTSMNEDGTPSIVLNLGLLKTKFNNDVELLVYKMLEYSMQVWDNKFYFVFDFTEGYIHEKFCEKFLTLLQFYAPEQLMKNCARMYYFNVPMFAAEHMVKSMTFFRQSGRSSSDAKLYVYSLIDGPEIVKKLGLSSQTVGIMQDTRVAFHNVGVYDYEGDKFVNCTLKIGRKWVQIHLEDSFSYPEGLCETGSFQPILLRKLSEVTKCEVVPGDDSDGNYQFVIEFNDFEKFVLNSAKRAEIIRFLYFATSRLPAVVYTDDVKEVSSGESVSGKAIGENDAVVSTNDNEEVVPFLWFARLYNSVFQALLCPNEEVRSAGSFLYAALSSYFDMDMGISVEHSKNIAFPANTTDFIVSTSRTLANRKPELSFRFFKAFFDYFDKLPNVHRASAIMYISPWIDNVCDFIFLSKSDRNGDRGTSRTIDIIRQFCRISANDKDYVPYINEYIWKKLFREARLTSVLIDEVVAFAIDNINEGPDWTFIIQVITPSVEVCNELMTRLIDTISETTNEGSLVAVQSNLIEISVLIKVCSVVFFDSYYYAQMYIADVFFVCTLFVNHPSLDGSVGIDLQKLINNIVQSFLHKPNLTESEATAIGDTLTYLSSQRAHLLFGVKRDVPNNLKLAVKDPAQIYNKATSFEVLCDHLSLFLSELGESSDLLAKWRSRWCTNAIDISFKRSCVFNSRALLIVGILSKSGIGDSLASRILKITTKESTSSLAYLTSQIVSTSRIVQGLSKRSVLSKYFFWAALTLTLLDNIVIYQPAAHLFINVLDKTLEQYHEEGADSGEKLVEKVFESRLLLEPFVSDFEKTYDMKFSPENIEVYIFFSFIRGLNIPHIKHSSLTCLMDYVRLRLKYGHKVTSSCLRPYLAFIYLSSTDTQFKKFMEEIDSNNDLVLETHDSVPPQFVIKYFIDETDKSKFVLLQAANFYNSESVDATFKTNFLNLYKDLLYLRKAVGYYVNHIIKEQLEKTLIYSNSIETVQTISDILLYSIQDGGYRADKYVNEIRSKFDSDIFKGTFQNKLTIINEDNFDEKRMLSEIRNISEVVYRASCSYVEGQRLEE
ncbi:hypothetical protein CLIB1423_06S05424 [[Candida] railenensis]|uniref:Ras-GAP domain-containing protein n=1 Tax=[Candida] railenensis TaxID=45579 RepID=A0A9P0QNB7_9ASCO|nr:hypothetical protein CLIB1423_06S05424 [[Candida] railenensis]